MEIRTDVLAEVDDMAMSRLLARDTRELALVPTVVDQAGSVPVLAVGGKTVARYRRDARNAFAH